MTKKSLFLAAAVTVTLVFGVTATIRSTPAQAQAMEKKGDRAAVEKALTEATAQLNQRKGTMGQRTARAGEKTPLDAPSPKP